jgi:hypothetical protein
MSSTVRVVSRITRALAYLHPFHLPPFAMWLAFPTADYYGGSVAMGLSPVRRSRVSCMNDVQDGCRLPVRGLEIGDDQPSSLERVERYSMSVSSSREHWTITIVSSLGTCSLATGVQVIQLSPCRPGLDGHAPRWFQSISPSRTCYRPCQLSRSGKFDNPEVSRSTSPVLHGDHSSRDAAHHASVPFGFRVQVGSTTQRYHAQPLPGSPGIVHAAMRRTNRRLLRGLRRHGALAR